MIDNPKVSIIMATFNRAELISESLKAICKQTYQNWECLIVDDQSADNTREVVANFQKNDHRFDYHLRSTYHNKGLPGCRNQGIVNANGEYIIFMDDDDIPHPKLLEIVIREIRKAKVDYCRFLRGTFTGTFHYEYQNAEKYNVFPMEIGVLSNMITGKIPFNSCQVLWSISCFESNKFDEELLFAEEWECYTRILLEDYKGISVDQILYFARKHLNSNTGEYNQRKESRINSHIKAAVKIIKAVKEKKKIDPQLKKFFIRLGINLNSPLLINETVNAAGGGKYEAIKYRMGLKIYPFLKPLFCLKGKIAKI